MKKVEIREAFAYGWQAINKDFWYFTGLALVYMVIVSIPGMIVEENKLMQIVSNLLGLWLLAGLTRIGLDYLADKKRPFGDLFNQTKYFINMLGAAIITSILIGIGFILLVIPGIYLAMRFMFVATLIVDKDLSIMDAIKRSGELTEGIKLRLFVFVLASIGVAILGVLALGVGILVAWPIIFLAQLHIYRSLQKGGKTVESESHKHQEAISDK